ALGSRARDILVLVLGQCLRQTLAGISLGLVLGFGLTRVLASQLFQVQAYDPAIFLTVPVVLLAAAVLASWRPARRAAAVAPMEVIRG
ncbi:MAG: FtsX-like permease family protein, partial [Acidobacteriota bacterium]